MSQINSIRKNELATMYGLNREALRILMNVTYKDELEKVGYKIKSITLPPKVVRKFIELHGEPLQDSDFLVKLDPS